jgi:fatty acid desaturase
MTAPVFAAIRQSGSRAFRGEEKLWKVWWLAGIPVGCITAVLILAAERLRASGTWAWGWGDACDAARLLVYLAWFVPAWRCSRNVRNLAWTPLARGALLAGLVLSAMF